MKPITIICAETRPSHIQSAINTLTHCINKLPCKEAILFTDKPQATNEITVVSGIPNMNKVEDRVYDRFILTDLPNYIETSHYLIVQTDGYILDASKWDDNWLQYDYIGAPWLHHPHHYWPPHNVVGPTTSVGNGGFSLRSKVLGMMVKDIFFHLSKQGSFRTEHWYPEDCFICRDLRPLLENHGIKFAPESEAQKFSFENKRYNGEFGFHGKLTMELNSIKQL